MPRRARAQWTTALSAVALALAVVNSGNLWARLWRSPERWREDPMALYLARFEPLLAQLPPQTRFGFVSDQATRSEPLHVEIAGAPYMLARYAVRPFRLVDDAAERWLIGDFESAAVAQRAAAALGCVLRFDCGNGVVLMQRP